MKKKQRAIYWEVAKEELPMPYNGILGLCNLCQWAEFSGDCYEGDLDCKHPIWQISDNYIDTWSGDDCWGFRPKYKLEDTVDMIGVFLQGKMPDMSRCRCKKAYKER